VAQNLLQVEAKANINAGRIDNLTTVIEDLQVDLNTHTDDIGKLQNEASRAKMSANAKGGQNKMVDTSRQDFSSAESRTSKSISTFLPILIQLESLED